MTDPNTIDYTTYTGEVQTRDGHTVRILCRDRSGPYPIVAIVGEGESNEVRSFRPNGWWGGSGPGRFDLISTKSRVVRTYWLNIYGNGGFGATESKASADFVSRAAGRLACVKIDIDVEVGHGLDGDAT